MGGLLTRKVVLLAKKESAYNTDPTTSFSTDAVEIYNLSLKYLGETIERKPLRESLSPRPIRKSLRTMELTFETELKGSGTAGTAGRLSPLFQACAMVETVSAGSSVTYVPGSTFPSVWFDIYQDGLHFEVGGAMGTFEITAEAGKIPMVKWTFRGMFRVSTDASSSTPTYESTIGVPMEGTQTQLNSYEGIVRSYSLNVGNELVNRASMNASGAVEGVRITDRKPTGKYLCEAELRATEDVIGDFQDVTQVDFQSIIGTVAGNIVTITSTAGAQYDDIGFSDDNGIFMFDISLVFSGTDDEFTIKMT